MEEAYNASLKDGAEKITAAIDRIMYAWTMHADEPTLGPCSLDQCFEGKNLKHQLH